MSQGDFRDGITRDGTGDRQDFFKIIPVAAEEREAALGIAHGSHQRERRGGVAGPGNHSLVRMRLVRVPVRIKDIPLGDKPAERAVVGLAGDIVGLGADGTDGKQGREQ